MRYVHFIGIGGAGMSGLAEILLARGIQVSGSDLVSSAKILGLKKRGAKIHIGHAPQHIPRAVDTVVYSSAADATNPELIEAGRRHLPLIRRAEFLGNLTHGLKTIAVAGTHGKTTTTSMIAHILIEAGLDPLVSVGASVKELGGNNAYPGKGPVAVVEADEYDRSFLALSPYIAVMTTLEPEHLDIYRDIADLEETFVKFANNRQNAGQQGFAVVNIDEPSLRRILPKLEKRVVSFGLQSPEAKYRATDIKIKGLTASAAILCGNERVAELRLRSPGEHNIKNALAAIAVTEILAIPIDLALRALASFEGPNRRLETIGEKNGVLVIDDYAHHPTEVRATLSALRTGFPGQRIIAAFQPHTYTRTRDFADDFGKVFAEYADELFLLDIYPAREKPIAGVTTKLIYDAVRRAGLGKVSQIDTLELLPKQITSGRKKGDIIITLGAGSITEAAPHILRNLH